MSSTRAGYLECAATSVAWVPAAGGPPDTQVIEPIAADASDWTTAAASAIARLGHRTGGRPRATLIVPSHLLLARHLRAPAVAGRRREQAIRFEAARVVPVPLEEVEWGCVQTGRAGDAADFLLLAAKVGPLAALGAAAEAAGFRLEAAWPAVLALRTAVQPEVVALTGGALVVAPGPRAHEILWLEAAHGSVRLAAAVEAPDVATTERATAVAMEVARTLRQFQASGRDGRPAEVWLLGIPESDTAAWADSFRARFDVPVRVHGPAHLDRLRVHGCNRLAAAATCSVDLLPPAQRASRSARRRAPWFAAAAAILFAALVPPIMHHRAAADAARAMAASLDRELAPLREWEARRAAQQARGEEIQVQLAAFARVDAERGRWISLLADLQERLAGVEDVWFDRLEVRPGSPQADARIAVSGRMLDRANPLERASPDAQARLRALVERLEESPFVSAVGAPRIDPTQPGILRFECELVPETSAVPLP